MNNRDIIKIYAHEAELERKRIEREERLRKLQEEKKAKKEADEKALKRVIDAIELVNHVVEEYEKETGNKLEFLTVNGKLRVDNGEYYVPILPFTTFNTHSKWWDDFYKAIREF